MGSKLDSKRASKKWSRNLQAAAEDMVAGVNSVTEAPGVAAAKRQDTLKARLLKAIDSGKWARNTAGVPLQEWQQRMIQAGIPHAIQGAVDNESKTESVMEDIFSQIAAVQRTVRAMPNGTDAEREARMNANLKGMRKVSKKTRGR